VNPPLLVVENVGKSYPGVRALDGVSFALARGEVLAVCGENGAGKSTLMKIIAGVVVPDAGRLELDGVFVRPANPAEAMALGISLIHQELSLAENLTVLENLFLGRELTIFGPLGLLNTTAMAEQAGKILTRVGLAKSLLHVRVGSLSPGQKQLVEIGRALGRDTRILIMDEPTSSLTQTETERLYEVIGGLKASGISVLYISHRLAEIRACADRVIVLRDGRFSGELAKEDITHENLIRLMVGRDLTQYFPHTRGAPSVAKPTLVVDELEFAGGRAAVSFQVRRGEVLGMAGLIGSGRTETAEAVFGIRGIRGGRIQLEGMPMSVRKPSDAVKAGLVLVPEDRRHHGLILEASVGSNLSLANLDRLSRSSWIGAGRERLFHRSAIDALAIKTPSAWQVVGALSGGNQQKVVFAKWLERAPKVLILDEPTRGVDVGAKAEIYSLIDKLCARGTAVWMITSDLEELLGLSDRVVVMHEGRLSAPLERADFSEEAVMSLAVGGKS